MNLIKYKNDKKDKLISFMDSNKIDIIRLIDKDLDTGRTIYLENDNEILGIVTTYYNDFHPNFLKLQFAVDTSNELFVNELYQGILKSNSSSHTFSIHLNEKDSKQLEVFLERNNFKLVLKTEFPKINIEKSFENLSNYSLPNGFVLKKYKDLNENETKELRNFRLKGYVKTHFWSPPLSIEHPYWDETDLDDESKNISWVVYKNNNIVICSDAHIENSCVYFGWGWHDDTYDDFSELKSLWATVLYKQLDFCKKNNKTLIGEFDSSDKYGQYKSSLLVHLTEENYYTFHKI